MALNMVICRIFKVGNKNGLLYMLDLRRGISLYQKKKKKKKKGEESLKFDIVTCRIFKVGKRVILSRMDFFAF
jgi:hypothetical protein